MGVGLRVEFLLRTDDEIEVGVFGMTHVVFVVNGDG